MTDSQLFFPSSFRLQMLGYIQYMFSLIIRMTYCILFVYNIFKLMSAPKNVTFNHRFQLSLDNCIANRLTTVKKDDQHVLC